MSLRARLVLTLLLLATAGLVVLGAVTYASQRSFQEDQLDDRVTIARQPIAARLFCQTSQTRCGFERSTSGTAGPAGPGGVDAAAPRGNGGPDLGGFDATQGSYGQLRSASGSVVAQTSTTTGPKLPTTLHAGDRLTVRGRQGGSYRVAVFPAERGYGRGGPAPAGSGSGGLPALPTITTTPGELLIVALPRSEVVDTLHRLLVVEALVIVGVLLVLGVLAYAIVRIGLRPLERMGATAGAIAAGELDRRVEETSPRTEVGRLGLALNGMLGRLELAFAEREASEGRLRQFLSDASHELRTPLSSIRGYAELFRLGAARSPEDVAKAMGRIEDEAERMGVLVEDLLVLARLDEVRDAVPEEVDLSSLAHDAVADAGAQEPERDIALTGEDDVRVLGDPNQLRQVLANLVRNALVHTPSGAPIEVGATHDGPHAVLRVRDHGPGLPPGDPAALFGRFWRAQGKGRERGKAGAGLGLAIVAGIVAAHGGQVTAADAPGGGALFTVRLPALAPVAEPVGAHASPARSGSRPFPPHGRA